MFTSQPSTNRDKGHGGGGEVKTGNNMLLSIGKTVDVGISWIQLVSFFFSKFLLFIYLFIFKFYFIFKLYNIVLVLPNIKMNPPQVYMCSPTWTLLPPPSPYHPFGSSQCTRPKIQYRASNLDWQLISYMILYIFQCHSPKSSHPLPLPQSP